MLCLTTKLDDRSRHIHSHDSVSFLFCHILKKNFKRFPSHLVSFSLSLLVKRISHFLIKSKLISHYSFAFFSVTNFTCFLYTLRIYKYMRQMRSIRSRQCLCNRKCDNCNQSQWNNDFWVFQFNPLQKDNFKRSMKQIIWTEYENNCLWQRLWRREKNP